MAEEKSIDDDDRALIAAMVARYGAEAVIAVARSAARRRPGRPREAKNSDAGHVGIWLAMRGAIGSGGSVASAARKLHRAYRKRTSGPRFTEKTFAKIYYQIEARRKSEPALAAQCELLLHGIEVVRERLGADLAGAVILPASGILEPKG